MFNLDYSQLECDDYYKLSNGLELKNYTIKEIKTIGEFKYYSLLHCLVCSASERMIELYDEGIDFRSVDDFDMFIFNNVHDNQVNNELLSYFIKDAEFEYISESNSKYLINNKNSLMINKDIHFEMCKVLRAMNGIVLSKDDIYNPVDLDAFEYIVSKLKRRREIREMKIAKGLINLNKNSIFYSIVPAVINNGENGINYFNFKDLKLFQLLESFEMINKALNFNFTMYGVYSGTIEYNKTDKPTWTRA